MNPRFPAITLNFIYTPPCSAAFSEGPRNMANISRPQPGANNTSGGGWVWSMSDGDAGLQS
jgi:hypothetical protein